MGIVRISEANDTGGGYRVQIDSGADNSVVVLSNESGSLLSKLDADGVETALAATTEFGNFRSGYVETLSDGRYALYTTYHFGLNDGTRVQILNRDGSAATDVIDTMFEDQNRSGSGYTLTATDDGGFAFVYNDTSRAGDQHLLTYAPVNGHTQNNVSSGYDVRVRYFDANAVATAPSVVADDDVESINGATVSRRAADQYINDSETLAGGQTAFAYMDNRYVGKSGGGAGTEWEVSVQISSPGNVGEPIKVDLGPYNEQFGSDYPQAIDPSASVNIVALPDGGFAVIWTENTYVAAPVWGGWEFSGYQTVIRYFDAAGTALTDPIAIVTRGTEHGNHSRYVWGEALPDGSIAIAYNKGVGGVNGNGTLDAFIGVVGPLGTTIEVSQVNPTAANTQFYTIQDLAVRSDGTIELAYTDARTFPDGYANHTVIERFGLTGAGIGGRIGDDSAENWRGGGLADTVFGAGGDDLLDGLGGDDRLRGGAGHDRVFGGFGDDRLFGDAGNDVIGGGAGADRMDGGSGDDLYVVDDAGDRVVERAGAGNDTVRAYLDHILADNVEGLRMSGGARIGIGNMLDNVITGSTGDDRIEGNDGADMLKGEAGLDQLLGGNGNDTLYGGNLADALDGGADSDLLFGGSGNDTLAGGAGADRLFGDGGHDVLDGGDGIDWLRGGLNTDRLTGGLGADEFRFDDGESAPVRGSADVIVDFSAAQGDLIHLRWIDANEAVAGDQNFRFIGEAVFSGAAGELRVAVADGHVFAVGDTDGDAVADFVIRVEGVASLAATDFLL